MLVYQRVTPMFTSSIYPPPNSEATHRLGERPGARPCHPPFVLVEMAAVIPNFEKSILNMGLSWFAMVCLRGPVVHHLSSWHYAHSCTCHIPHVWTCPNWRKIQPFFPANSQFVQVKSLVLWLYMIALWLFNNLPWKMDREFMMIYLLKKWFSMI